MKYLILILLVGVFYSCRKDTPVFPPVTEPEPWEKFIGDYKVYDTTGVFLYDMSISHHSTFTYPNLQVVDSLHVDNFGNKFELFTDPLVFGLPHIDPIEDHDGYNWYFTGIFDDLGTQVKENYWLNDTIIFYYRITNILYYIGEGQPYYLGDHKEITVKQ